MGKIKDRGVERERFWADFSKAMEVSGLSPQAIADELELSREAIYSYMHRRAIPAGSRKKKVRAWIDKYLPKEEKGDNVN